MEPGIYENRRHAGTELAARLSHLEGRGDVVILALPRGGVPVAFEVAQALGAPLDVFLVRKLGVPGRREIPRKTSAASAICGTHFGLTNADTSIAGRPAVVKRSTNAILSVVATFAASFCSPSRGPTS